MPSVLEERPSVDVERPDAGADRAPVLLARALQALEGFVHRDVCGVRQLARDLDISPSTAAHLLTGLERLGMLQRTDDRRYRLGWRAAALGSVLAAGFRPAELAAEVLSQLAGETGETAHLASLHGTDVVYLAKVEGRHAVRLASQVGQRFPAHATACGKALLAFDRAAADAAIARGLRALTEQTVTDEAALRAQLDAIRAGGLARDREEIELHAACAALPVLPRADEPVRLALSVSGARPRIEQSLPMLEAALRRATVALSERLHGAEADRI